MNRRELLSLLAGAAVGELIVPKRKIFLPPAGGWPALRQGLFIFTRDGGVVLQVPTCYPKGSIISIVQDGTRVIGYADGIEMARATMPEVTGAHFYG